jgi:hypothetical protein
VATLLTVGVMIARTGAAAAPGERRDFIIKAGVMEPADARGDRLRETLTISADPSRRPGWCFLVDPPTRDSYEVYSVHYLPMAPERLTGDFAGIDPRGEFKGLKSEVKRVDGIRPFCFDFHAGDRLGEYRVAVFINGVLKTTLHLQVIAPSPIDEGGNT